MNCESFKNGLQEYLDETLSAAEQAAAKEHAQNCPLCWQTLAREEAFAKSVRQAFNRETEGLSLRPEIRQNFLNALKRPELKPTVWENIRAFWSQPAWGGAVIFCLLLLVAGSHFYLHPTNKKASICVIDVPIQTETHVYRSQNNLVVDAVVTGVSVIDARLIN